MNNANRYSDNEVKTTNCNAIETGNIKNDYSNYYTNRSNRKKR